MSAFPHSADANHHTTSQTIIKAEQLTIIETFLESV
jgi:hypothetical protein